MTAHVDVVIVGGGIAGLWTLALLRDSGYSALLLESVALGTGQTACSQGIIHGGTKYSLQGAVTGAARAISAMPGEWRRALAGNSPVDLSQARVLSQEQYLWCNQAPGPRIAAFFASQAMGSRMRALRESAFPAVFASAAFRGRVYRLDEPVVDVISVLQCLRDRHRPWLLLNSTAEIERLASPPGAIGLRIRAPDGGHLEVRAQRLLLCAAGGNARLAKRLGEARGRSQRRPLKMVMVRGDLPELYGHAMGVSSVPRLTITSHHDGDGRRVWYIGGGLAESGVGATREVQLQTARGELHAALPWIDQRGLQWAILDIDRVEAPQADGKRPDTEVLECWGPMAVAWPTKLALAPALAQRYLRRLREESVSPRSQTPTAFDQWPRPAIAARPWDQALQWT